MTVIKDLNYVYSLFLLLCRKMWITNEGLEISRGRWATCPSINFIQQFNNVAIADVFLKLQKVLIIMIIFPLKKLWFL